MTWTFRGDESRRCRCCDARLFGRDRHAPQATAFVPGKTLKRPKSSPVYASPEEILTGVYTEKIDVSQCRAGRSDVARGPRPRRGTIGTRAWARRRCGDAPHGWRTPKSRGAAAATPGAGRSEDPRAQVWACGIAIMSLVGGLGAFEAKTYLALHSEGVAGALALRAHARSPELVAFLEALLERDAAKRTSAAGALAAHATWLAGSPTPCPVLTDPPSDGSSARRLADFHVRARAQLARVNLQRAVNRGLRRAPSDEVDVLACAVRDDNKARNARRAAAAAPATSPQRGPSTPTRRPSATFRKSVQMVIVANREAKVKFVDEVLGRATPASPPLPTAGPSAARPPYDPAAPPLRPSVSSARDASADDPRFAAPPPRPPVPTRHHSAQATTS